MTTRTLDGTGASREPMTTPGQVQAERDGLLAVLSEVRRILDKWHHPYVGSHSYHCMHAVAELRALLNPQEETDA